MQALATTRTTSPPGRHPVHVARTLAPVTALPTVSARGGGPVAAQGGFFDVLGQAAPGILGAASSLLGGNSAGALDQVRQTGAGIAPGLVEQGVSGLGGLVGGSAGQTISSLGGAAGQGVGSVLSGEQSVGQAAGGLLQTAQPAILSLLMSLLQG